MPRSSLSRPGDLVEAGLADIGAALRRTSRQVAIATPFLSGDVAAHIVRAADEAGVKKRRLIVALNSPAVEGGYLDPEGVEQFLAARFATRSLLNLHAKVVLADGSWGLIGSGNLTVAGVNGGNAELGVVLSQKQARAAQRIYERWWTAAEPLDVDFLRALKKKKRPRSPERRRRTGRGGVYRNEAGIGLPKFTGGRGGSGYWLKILYGSDDRAKASHWKGRFWVSDRHTFGRDGSPKRRPSYKAGEHLVIYVSRGQRQACPAIVRVAEEPEFDPARVAREAGRKDAKKWGWVTWVDGFRAMDLAEAPRLRDIGVDPQSVRQHGHIRLDHEQYRRALRLLS